MNSAATQSHFTWRDGVCYLLAALAWLALSVANALALLAVKSLVGPLTLAMLVRDPVRQQHSWEIFAQAGTFDSIARVVVGLIWLVYVLIVEEYLRASIGEARAQRRRALSAGTPVAEASFSGRGLDVLAHRTLIAAIFPAAATVLYLLLQGVLWLLLRS